MPKTTYKDIQNTKTESAVHQRTGVYSAFGRSHCYITCPFCQAETKAFVWSLAGGGKRCSCGALHTNLGLTYRKRN
jgi:hypothetical protein